MTTYIALKSFKYGDPPKELQPGDEVKAVGGKWDHIMFDLDKKYVRPQNDAEIKATQIKKTPAKKTKIKAKSYKCDYCTRKFDTPQGKAAHMRFCKEKE